MSKKIERSREEVSGKEEVVREKMNQMNPKHFTKLHSPTTGSNLLS